SFLFFFQAEDGIRDFHVTGVQTCALPILRTLPSSTTNMTGLRAMVRGSSFTTESTTARFMMAGSNSEAAPRCLCGPSWWCSSAEIGRASCRESLDVLGVVVCIY